jgi:hypothetical protein
MGRTMAYPALIDEIHTFLEEYNTGFASIDGKRIAALYHNHQTTQLRASAH